MVGRKQDESHSQEWPRACCVFPLHAKNKKVFAGLWPEPWGCGGKPAPFVATGLLACPWPGITAQDHPSEGTPALGSTCSSLTEIQKVSISTSSKQKSNGVKVTGLQPGATSQGHPWLSQTRARHSQSAPDVTRSPFGNGRGETNQPPRMSPLGGSWGSQRVKKAPGSLSWCSEEMDQQHAGKIRISQSLVGQEPRIGAETPRDSPAVAPRVFPGIEGFGGSTELASSGMGDAAPSDSHQKGTIGVTGTRRVTGTCRVIEDGTVMGTSRATWDQQVGRNPQGMEPG